MRHISIPARVQVRRLALNVENDLAEAIAATAELCGQPLSFTAARLLARDLANLQRSAVFDALARCRIELHGALNIGEVLARIDDGRPGVEEAWDMLPTNEAASVVWTAEMAQAWGKAWPLLQQGEREAARRIFQENYVHAVLMARCRQEKVHWTASLGTDPQRREQVLQEALRKERLTSAYVKNLLPYRSLSAQSRSVLKQIRLKNFP